MITKPQYYNLLVLMIFLVWKLQSGTSMRLKFSLYVTPGSKPSRQETSRRGQDSPTIIHPRPVPQLMRPPRDTWFRCAKGSALTNQIPLEKNANNLSLIVYLKIQRLHKSYVSRWKTSANCTLMILAASLSAHEVETNT